MEEKKRVTKYKGGYSDEASLGEEYTPKNNESCPEWREKAILLMAQNVAILVPKC